MSVRKSCLFHCNEGCEINAERHSHAALHSTNPPTSVNGRSLHDADEGAVRVLRGSQSLALSLIEGELSRDASMSERVRKLSEGIPQGIRTGVSSTDQCQVIQHSNDM